MKTKLDKFKWATALCSVAFFFLISASVAPAGLIRDPNGDSVKEPQTDDPPTEPRVWWIDPISPAEVRDDGSFSGTITE